MNQIILHEMSKSFGKKNVIKAQNACFSPGQIYGIVGQNGCGKTVLFKCMSGLMPVLKSSWTTRPKRRARTAAL